MKEKVGRFIERFKQRKGQGLVEYALLAGFIALSVILALGTLGQGIYDFFTGFTGKLADIMSGW